MLVTIARRKAGSTHFAVKVDHSGHVAEWSADAAAAVPVRDDVADRVAAFYARRPLNAGTVVFAEAESGREYREPVRGTSPPAPKAKPGDPSPQAGLLEARAAAEEYRTQAVTLGEEVEKLRAENTALRAKVAELEAIIASAK